MCVGSVVQWYSGVCLQVWD